MRCRIWSCDWEGNDWLAHRALEHPTAESVARQHEARLGREPKAVETFPAAAASRSERARVLVAPSPRPVAAEPGSRPAPHCVYCGAKVVRGEVCAAHSDLPGLEPLDELVVAA